MARRVSYRSAVLRLAAVAVALGAAVAVAPAAATAQSSFPSSGRGCATAASGTCVESPIEVAGAERDAVWYLPDGPVSALMLLEHGFSRSCANLDGTARAIAGQGLMVVCLDEDMTAGNPALADDLADALARRTVVPPNGLPLPQRYVVGGHSAGGHFAALVGAGLVERGYPDLAGAVLFDPVAAEGFSAAVRSVSAGGTRPVLSIAASPSVVNLFDNSFGALASLGSGFVGVQLLGGSCHVDVEGEDTDLIGIVGAACAPDPVNTARLRELGGVWARDLAAGTRTETHWCADTGGVSVCGDAVATMLLGARPAAALIPVR
ncbi:alpha/beta hydrolase [Rhodococcus gannanensis]|uniref:Alpha/beta hydrolase n=1 Tax=Rhodococcus gannanensis TaxID=1960308 RepID=A0ABW4P879_9NOCA